MQASSAVTITYDAEEVSRWVAEQMGAGTLSTDMGVGVRVNGKLVAGLVAYDHTGSNVWSHIAVAYPHPAFIPASLDYLFVKLGVERVTMLVHDSNVKSIRFMEAIGAKLEHTLKQGYSGGDLLLYVLWKNTGVHAKYADLVKKFSQSTTN
jgi:hypothetical protein